MNLEHSQTDPCMHWNSIGLCYNLAATNITLPVTVSSFAIKVDTLLKIMD